MISRTAGFSIASAGSAQNGCLMVRISPKAIAIAALPQVRVQRARGWYRDYESISSSNRAPVVGGETTDVLRERPLNSRPVEGPNWGASRRSPACEFQA